MWGLAVAIRGPHQSLAIGREHGKGVEIGCVGDALEARAVFVGEVQVEIAAILWIGHVR